MSSKILIAGGYGLVGGTIARHIRKIKEDVEIILAGRNPKKGENLANELGNARVVSLDLNDLQTVKELDVEQVDLIVSAVQDPRDLLIDLAIDNSIAHIGITKLADDISPIALKALHSPPKRPIVLLGHNEAGITTLVTSKASQEFASIDTIEIATVYDDLDPVGPMTAGDLESEELTLRSLIRKEGKWLWVNAQQHTRKMNILGKIVEGMPMGLLDIPSLGAITQANNIRWDFVQGESVGTLAGKNASHEVYIDIEGTLKSGERAKHRTVISDSKGQAHLTALGVLMCIERVLGFDGQPFLQGGLQIPETLLSADQAFKRLQDFGIQIYQQD
ncbi:NAD-binding protein [Shimazuella kribbensis]|uniref:NAD-binding protein n=1 Tax=Shimazuella kribbensis TaxID=139808 RepID=UPI00041E1E5B|nr:NAD-binding protein [Shimazuella kribbensis]